MHNTPFVTIILPTYNRQDKILQCVASILAQTYKCFSLYVIDDASTDKTANVVQWIWDKRVQYFQLSLNWWPSIARNFGLNIARTKYIAFLDSDDIWSDNKKLEKQVQNLEENKDTVLVGCQGINNFGELYSWPLSYNDFLKKAFYNCSPHIDGWLIRREIIEKYGIRFWNYWAEDYEFLLHLWSVWPVYCLDFFWFIYDVNPKSRYLSNAAKTNFESLYFILKYRKKYPNWPSPFIYRIKKMIRKFPNWILLRVWLYRSDLFKNI